MRRLYRARLLAVVVALLLLVGSTALVHAQSYSFQVQVLQVDLTVQQDGSVQLEYYITFVNDPGAHPIDVVDLGLPNNNFSDSNIHGDVDGQPIDGAIKSDYQGNGTGTAVWLGEGTIPAGQTGTVHLVVDGITGMLYQDSKDSSYASIEFSPVTFGSDFLHGTTQMTVRFHLPPGVQASEPRYHSSPPGFPSQPQSEFDANNRVVYIWTNQAASDSRTYVFGASFPAKYVEASAIQKPPSPLSGFFAGLGAIVCNPVVWVIGIIVLIVVFSARAQAKRRMDYLPPSMSVEGVGIKRGLTAVEAALLLQTPLNRVLTMILFGLVKKNAIVVLDDNPLKIQVNQPLPQDLHPYETSFVGAVKPDGSLDEAKLRTMMVDLVKDLNSKMKGFSRKESIAYYRDIVKRAWDQVDKAETPEVRGQLFGEGLEWTMLDDDFAGRTQRTFQQGPVYVPVWWGNYRPWGMPTTTSAPRPTTAGPSMPSGPVRLPTLPGGDFAAKIVRGMTNTAGRVVRSVTDFTGGVTNTTNPPPPPSSSGGSRGGGSSGGHCVCACACACAGCACACAGGGR